MYNETPAVKLRRLSLVLMIVLDLVALTKIGPLNASLGNLIIAAVMVCHEVDVLSDRGLYLFCYVGIPMAVLQGVQTIDMMIRPKQRVELMFQLMLTFAWAFRLPMTVFLPLMAREPAPLQRFD